MKNLFSLIITLFVFSTTSFSQDFSLGGDQEGFKEPVTWTTHAEKINDKEYYLVFKAKIEDKWHLYSQYNPDGASLPLSFTSEQADSLFTIEGKALENKPTKSYTETFKKDEIYFEHSAVFKQKIKLIKEGVSKITMNAFGQACKKACVLIGGDFDFDLTKATTVTEMDSENAPNKKDNKGLWFLFLFSFGFGLTALFTPCVFPMIPMTVSVFTKQSKSKKQGRKNAFIFGLSIIVLYVALGLIVSALFGPSALNELSTNPWFNFAFFVLLIVFAISFLGAFEIMLPNSWANKIDSKADKGGYLGIFFMALALAIISFSCTSPIVGTALVASVKEGGMAPVISMLGFSTALAIPFTLFAMFPSWLNSLPKSGGWLNTVKVVLGFLELGFAFKFLSMADIAWQTHFIERETFIAIWIAVFGTLVLYLFGKIKLPHDSSLNHLSVGRLLLGIFTLTFVIYLIPGLWGAPLKIISGFPPPMNYSESPYGVGYKKLGTSNNNSKTTIKLPDGAHLMKPFDIITFEDYDVGLTYAKKVNKPILLDFTGENCVNCRKMEEQVWTDQKILPIIKNEFVLISLVVDTRTKLPKKEQYTSESGKKIRTIGNKWSDFQMTRYGTNSQPYYLILDHDEKTQNGFTAYDPDIDKYYNWLKEGLDNFKK